MLHVEEDLKQKMNIDENERAYLAKNDNIYIHIHKNRKLITGPALAKDET